MTLKNNTLLFLAISTSTLYFIFAYTLERTEFVKLLLLYAGLFSSYFYMLKKRANNFQLLLGFSIFFRLLFLFSIPNLSQDFYRFIWDGRMLFEGLNPYISLPETFIKQGLFPVNQATELYAGMGTLNGSHYTNYPPIHQLCFYIAALFSNQSILGSVIAMRLLLIFADIGIIFFGKKILEKMKLPIHTIFWYALNPFIIIELTWNLHFEPVMLFFLLWSFYTLICQKWGWSAVLLGISVSVKLIPLLFLPLFYQWFTSPLVRNTKASFFQKWRPHFFGMTKLIAFSSVVLGVNIVLFLPFLSSKLISSYTNSVGLWFQNFEFNASFYYLFREIGYLFRGYNEIAIIGKIMPLLTIVFLGFMTFFRKNKTPKELFTALLFGLSFYYFTTTTMHPWYLATLIILAVFTEYRFPIVWSCVIILSYAAYATETYKENIGLLFLEYSVVYGFLIGELYFKKKA